MTGRRQLPFDRGTGTIRGARSFPYARAASCALFALAAAAPCARAQAAHQAPTFALNWVRGPGAEGCIASGELARRVEQLLGPVFRTADVADRAIEGLVIRDAARGRFEVSLHVTDRAGGSIGERRFEREAAECSDLNDSILLVIALTIDPTAGERGLPAELLGLLAQEQDPGAALLAELARERAERTADAAEQPAVGVNAQPPDAPQRAARSEPEPAVGTRVAAARPRDWDQDGRWAIELALAGAASAGVQPAIDFGASATARLSTPWPIAFELGASYWLPSAAPLAKPAVRGESVDFQAALTTLTACVPVVSARVRVSACAGGMLGARWTRGGVAVGAGSSTRAFYGPAATADARYALTRRWFVLLAASIVGAFPRDRFFYTDGLALRQPLYEPSAVAGWVALGVGARL